MFLITRALAEGVRVFAIATVVSVVLGTGDVWSILIISGLTLIYTFEGDSRQSSGRMWCSSSFTSAEPSWLSS